MSTNALPRNAVLREFFAARGFAAEAATKLANGPFPDALAAVEQHAMVAGQKTARRDVSAAEGETLALGATQERQRIKAIMSCPEATGREDQAKAIALGSELSEKTAREMLAAMPQQVVGQSDFARHMAAIGNPDVTAGGDAELGPEAAPSRSWANSINRVHQPES